MKRPIEAHDPSKLAVVLRKIRTWMDRQATSDEAEATRPGQFLSLAAAHRADAKNYRAMIREIDAVLKPRAPEEGP